MKSRLFAILIFFAIASPTAFAQIGSNGCNQGTSAEAVRHATTQVGPADAYLTTYKYLVTFYPRWFTYYQSSFGSCNSIAGPNRVTALYQYVVAINVDTLYASSFVSVADGPVNVHIPAVQTSEGKTYTNFSVLQLNLYGNVFPGVPSKTPGDYCLIAKHGDSSGCAPGSTQVTVPYDYSVLIFRGDKAARKDDGSYLDVTDAAAAFREGIVINGTPTRILRQVAFALPFKTIAVAEITAHPVLFLRQLQTAVHASTTNPLTPEEQKLSDDFDALFPNAALNPVFSSAAQAAHTLIDVNYLTHTLPGTHWTNFTDIGEWAATPQGYLDRSSITDYLQFGNNSSAAVYYHAFADGSGKTLNGLNHTYTLTFPAGEQPSVSRFWSVTAYVPLSIELVPNRDKKYNVASYTPGLETNPDGSVTIYMSATQPDGVNAANWLPIPRTPFSIMLRAYGPTGSVAEGKYVPPAIERH